MAKPVTQRADIEPGCFERGGLIGRQQSLHAFIQRLQQIQQLLLARTAAELQRLTIIGLG